MGHAGFCPSTVISQKHSTPETLIQGFKYGPLLLMDKILHDPKDQKTMGIMVYSL